MAKEKKFIECDMFEFSINLKDEFTKLTKVIYTKSVENDDNITDDDLIWEAFSKHKKLIQEKYFTKQRISELKRKLVDRIMSSKNPFNISCTDYDFGYDVEEKHIFDVEK